MMHNLLNSGNFVVELRRTWLEKTTGATTPASGYFLGFILRVCHVDAECVLACEFDWLLSL